MDMYEEQNLDISIVMPCLDEESTVGICVREALAFLERNSLRGEVLVVDNGSRDRSAEAAAAAGARVIRQLQRGYGHALRAGIAHSRGRVIILGDCDTTYDFLHLEEMYQMLDRGGCDMVIGNRFTGQMEPGSMPWSHRWGVRMLSWTGRLLFSTDIRDFHCGLRGLTRGTAEKLDFKTGGMEFAAEMIVLAVKGGLNIGQCPADLRTCRCPRQSKLRTIRDGVRHLWYMVKMRLHG